MDSLFEEHRKLAKAKSHFDIFLSHSSSDAKLIFGVKQILEEQGLSVFVDWIDAPQLDRSKVTKETASELRKFMRNCSSFLYATSTNSTTSRWMPWEIGYFDGFRGDKIAIFPLIPSTSPTSTFQGQEYLGLYPYLEKITDLNQFSRKAGLAKTASTYITIRDFVDGSSRISAGHA